MASYKYDVYLDKSYDGAFDVEHTAGTAAPYSGIYRCGGCGREASSTHTHPLPPQNHHQHTPAQGAVRWRLAVWANHNPK